MDNENSINLIKQSVISTMDDCLQTFSNNKDNVEYTKKSLSLWLHNDMDKIIFSNRDEAQNYYQSVIFALNSFETEQIKFMTAFNTAMGNWKLLIGTANPVFYNDYLALMNKYYDTIAKSQTNKFGVIPNIAAPPSTTEFYRELVKIKEKFDYEMESYNRAVDAVLKYKDENHLHILGKGIIWNLFKNDVSVLRRTFDAFEISKIYIVIG